MKKILETRLTLKGTVNIFQHGIRKKWYLNEVLHREDGPAIECSNGDKEWYLNGKRHREDGPAFENKYGNKEWWLDGKRHRVDGPAISLACGCQEWWENGVNIKNKFCC